MTLNLDKNKTVLVHAWKEVLDERNPIDWALFGYDGLTYDLNLVGKGDGGLDELIEEFNSGKIQYALCRVKIKEKNLEKIILINWQGEGAPLTRKGFAANHVDIIRGFFKGVHVSIHARTDEDVEPDLLLSIVSKAIVGEGIKLTNNDTSINDNLPPVGSTYKRVNPQEEINAKAKNDFWRKDQAEEERRRREESGIRHRKFSQDEVKLLRKESQDYFDREEQQQQQEKNSRPSSSSGGTPSPSPQSQLNGNSFNLATNGTNGDFNKSNSTSPIPPPTTPTGPVTNTAERTAALQASMPMKKNNSELVRARIKSFDGGSSGPVFPTFNNTPPKSNVSCRSMPGRNNSFVGGVSNSSPVSSPSVVPMSSDPVNGNSSSEADGLSVLKRKQLFESGSPSATNSTTISRRNPADEIRMAQEESKKQLEKEKQQAKDQAKKDRPVSPQPKNSSNVGGKSVVVVTTKPLPHHEPEQDEPKRDEMVKSPVATFTASANPISPPPAVQQPAFFTNPTVSVPPKSPSPSPTPININKPPTPTPQQNSPAHAKDNRSAQVNGNGNAGSVSPVPITTTTDNNGDSSMITINITAEMGVCARALYDYQAADETEITFDPNEVITHIEKIDEGWWEGMGPNGMYGLFPANYVELIN